MAAIGPGSVFAGERPSPMIVKLCKPTKRPISPGICCGTPGALRSSEMIVPLLSHCTPLQVQTDGSFNQPPANNTSLPFPLVASKIDLSAESCKSVEELPGSLVVENVPVGWVEFVAFDVAPDTFFVALSMA